MTNEAVQDYYDMSHSGFRTGGNTDGSLQEKHIEYLYDWMVRDANNGDYKGAMDKQETILRNISIDSLFVSHAR